MKNYRNIILAYGIFLGWLLSFPYNGPILNSLVSKYDFSSIVFSLIYTVTPAVFLIIYSFFPIKEKYAKKIMVWGIVASIVGTIIIFITSPTFWYPIIAIMGIFSVLYIIGWSYFYTMAIPVDQKIKVMALVISTGNIIYYFVNLLHNKISTTFLFVIMLILLGGSLLATIKTDIKEKIPIQLEHEAFPVKLIFISSLFLFAINLNGGLTSHTIYPSFKDIEYSSYYSILPYILTLLIIYFYGHKISFMLPIFLGISLLGLAYLSFGIMGNSLYSFFITDTLMQSGWALLDLAIWSLFGLIASIYGRPLKISGYALLANLFAVFLGSLLGVKILSQLEDYFLVSAAFAISIIFISLVIIHWINETIEKDLSSKLFETTIKNKEPEETISLSITLPKKELLTTREREIAELLLQGYTNKEIAEMIYISENTMKTHTRNIYSKLEIANKRELLQLAFSTANSSKHSK